MITVSCGPWLFPVPKKGGGRGEACWNPAFFAPAATRLDLRSWCKIEVETRLTSFYRRVQIITGPLLICIWLLETGRRFTRGRQFFLSSFSCTALFADSQTFRYDFLKTILEDLLCTLIFWIAYGWHDTFETIYLLYLKVKSFFSLCHWMELIKTVWASNGISLHFCYKYSNKSCILIESLRKATAFPPLTVTPLFSLRKGLFGRAGHATIF